MSVVDSVDNILASSSTNGHFHRLLIDAVGTTTAATVNSGSTTWQRFPNPLTIPTVGAGLTGLHFTHIRAMTDTSKSGILVALETPFGTLTVSGNSFADGSAMPSKTIRGSSIQTGALISFAVVTTTLVATTPVLTITYTDQDGNTGQTATLTLPTNAAANSSFCITPHLANGDTAIRDITAVSISAGTAGVIKLFGCQVLYDAPGSAGNSANGAHILSLPKPMFIASAGEIVSVYRSGNTTSGEMMAMICGVAES